jgi:hypothetical protein
MAEKYMGRQQIQKVFDTVWTLDRIEDIARLTRLMVF